LKRRNDRTFCYHNQYSEWTERKATPYRKKKPFEYMGVSLHLLSLPYAPTQAILST
jgi:hypothetical protein